MHDLLNVNSSIVVNIFLSLLLSNVGYSGLLVMRRFVISTHINYENLFRTYRLLFIGRFNMVLSSDSLILTKSSTNQPVNRTKNLSTKQFHKLKVTYFLLMLVILK